LSTWQGELDHPDLLQFADAVNAILRKLVGSGRSPSPAVTRPEASLPEPLRARRLARNRSCRTGWLPPVRRLSVQLRAGLLVAPRCGLVGRSMSSFLVRIQIRKFRFSPMQ
jgi:hypothetical protein